MRWCLEIPQDPACCKSSRAPTPMSTCRRHPRASSCLRLKWRRCVGGSRRGRSLRGIGLTKGPKTPHRPPFKGRAGCATASTPSSCPDWKRKDWLPLPRPIAGHCCDVSASTSSDSRPRSTRWMRFSRTIRAKPTRSWWTVCSTVRPMASAWPCRGLTWPVSLTATGTMPTPHAPCGNTASG